MPLLLFEFQIHVFADLILQGCGTLRVIAGLGDSIEKSIIYEIWIFF